MWREAIVDDRREEPPADPAAEQPTQEPIERREALRRIGRYAAYTSPTMLTLLLPGSAQVDHQIGSPPPPEGGNRARGLSTPAVGSGYPPRRER